MVNRYQSINNDFENKPIENLKFDVPEFEVENEIVLVECSSCNRKFNENSIQKHENVCFKVFNQKRKKFNTKD